MKLYHLLPIAVILFIVGGYWLENHPNECKQKVAMWSVTADLSEEGLKANYKACREGLQR